MNGKKKTYVIIGGGPAGCSLAILLKRKGHNICLFNNSKKADLFVGESLIPAIIPYLQELGIEEEVKAFSKYKPGATVWVKEDVAAEASFSDGMGQLPPYAYNTIRKEFDTLLLETAIKEGVQVVNATAEIYNDKDSVLLANSSLQLANLKEQPNFIIDASGRKRLFAKLLDLPYIEGNRKDTALFAHIKERVLKPNQGDIHMHLATKGWCWQIPLKGATSVGIVVNKDYLCQHGSTKEEQFDNYLKQDSKLFSHFQNFERVSKVQRYSNYQLRSNRIFGKNWVLLGDAAGFLDPVFSSGLYFSIKYASELARVLDSSTNEDLAAYQKDFAKELESWKRMIDVWYNGRLFTNFLVGESRKNSFMGRRIEKHAIKHFTSIFTGEAVLNSYSMWLLSFMTGPLLDFMRFFKMHPYQKEDLAL